MSKIVLISCVSRKRPYKCKARDLYISALFQKNLQYARRLSADAIFVLSAKYGLIALDDEIEPYDLTLNTMSAQENRQWADRVLEELACVSDLRRDQFIFLAGTKYRKNLVPRLSHVEVPLEGLRIGEQLHALSQ